jgi:hypothetical protein
MADKNSGFTNLRLIPTNGYSSIDCDSTIEVNSQAFVNLNADTVGVSTNITIGGEVASDLIVSPGFAVGIGSTIPTASLDIIGDVSVSGSFESFTSSTLYHNNISRLQTNSSGIGVTGNLTVTANLDVLNRTDINQVTENVVNNFNTILAPSSGTLTVDTSLGTVGLGTLSASVTSWAFTNVPTTNSKATTITLIIDGNTSNTYGDTCNVNGTNITGGVKWSGGNTPTATNNFDVITFTIVRDGSGTINVFGSYTTDFV